MLKLRSLFLIALAILVAGSSAQAAIVFTANLTDAADGTNPTTVGGVPRTSFGFATFTLNDAMTAMTFTATITGIDIKPNGIPQSADTNDDLTAAHIHAGPTPAATQGVVWGFFGMPFNDNNPNDVLTTPFATGVGFTISGKWDAGEGNGTTLTAQIPNILAGRAYINFHTTQFGGGEIRGDIIAAVPEPTTMALLGLGTLALAAFRRRGAGIRACSRLSAGRER
jgi:hypothetical protein